MERKRDGLGPIWEAFGGLDGPVKAIREASPQALPHFTQADQVHQLVSASEADPDLGFMARLLALCSLPRHLAFRVLVEAAHPNLADAVSVHPVCQEELYNPGRNVSINPNEDSILMP